MRSIVAVAGGFVAIAALSATKHLIAWMAHAFPEGQPANGSPAWLLLTQACVAVH